MLLIGNKRHHFKALKEIAKSVRINTIRTLNAQNPASLYCLPIELICQIFEYLPTAETSCLIISCAQLWHARNAIPSFVRVQKQLNATTTNFKNIEEAEAPFHILRLMEYDKLFGKGTKSLCCWLCMMTHKRSRFIDS